MASDDPFWASLRDGHAIAPAVESALASDGYWVVERSFDVDEARRALDAAVATCDPADFRVSRSGANTRVHNLAHRGSVFDRFWRDPYLLAVVARALAVPFKLGACLSRTVNPGGIEQPLHVDHPRDGAAISMVGYIWMIDEFTVDNGATRLVPASQHCPTCPTAPPVVVTGRAGSLLIYDAALWHGHSANRTPRPRRSIQGVFVPRAAELLPSDKIDAPLDALGRYLLY